MEQNTAPYVPYSYVYSDGMVLYEEPVRVVSSCRLNIYTFPFDIQNCSLSFNSYIHLSKQKLVHGYLLFLMELIENDVCF